MAERTAPDASIGPDIFIERKDTMVASARKGTRRATQSSRQTPPMDTDVIDLLSEDHRNVEELPCRWICHCG